MNLLFSGCRIPDGLRVFFTLYLPHKDSHFRLPWLISGLSDTARLHCVVLLSDHLTNIRHSHIQILAILLWSGPDNNGHCLLFSALNSLEKMLDLSAIVHPTVAIIYQTLHYHVLLIVQENVLVQVPSFFLIIRVRSLQLSFCCCSLPGHMLKAKKSLMDIKEHSLTLLCTLSLFYIYISIHGNEDL